MSKKIKTKQTLVEKSSITPIFDTLAQLKELEPNLPDFSFAATDFKWAKEFLLQYDGNQATYNCYRRDVERIMHWAWLKKEKSILELKRGDIEEYIKFCIDPPKSWIGLKKIARFSNTQGERVPNKDWRPFVVTIPKAEFKKGKEPTKDDYSISQKGIREIFVALGSFYSYLVTENVLEANPVAAIRQKSKFVRKSQSAAQIPRLSKIQWKALIKATKLMAEEEPKKYERVLFMISALYLMYLRISELTASDRWTPLMKHFYKDGNDNWWFITVGKGNKERYITVSYNMLDVLERWRKYLKLSPALPTSQDNTPLIPKRGKGGIKSTRWINTLIQKCFNKTTDLLREQGKIDEADGMANATVHWLRHTGISDDINKNHRPIAHVRDDAGHASIATTDRYNDITLQERHDSGKYKTLEVKH